LRAVVELFSLNRPSSTSKGRSDKQVDGRRVAHRPIQQGRQSARWPKSDHPCNISRPTSSAPTELWLGPS
jgi:hypothetical protein